MFLKTVGEALIVHFRTADLYVRSIFLEAHKTESVRELIDKMGVQTTLRLPPYSPDLSSMEEGFSKIKAILLLHKVEAYSHEALGEA
jgi:transposase